MPQALHPATPCSEKTADVPTKVATDLASEVRANLATGPRAHLTPRDSADVCTDWTSHSPSEGAADHFTGVAADGAAEVISHLRGTRERVSSGGRVRSLARALPCTGAGGEGGTGPKGPVAVT